MSKDSLKGLIDMIDEKDVETIFQVLIHFVPENVPTSDEIKAIERANKSIEEEGTIPHDAINWN